MMPMNYLRSQRETGFNRLVKSILGTKNNL